MRLLLLDTLDWDYNIASVYEHPMGGSQSAFCYLAEALAKRGHFVSTLTNTTLPGKLCGVECLSLKATSAAQIQSLQVDCCIILNCTVDLPWLRQLVGPSVPLVLWTQHDVNQSPIQGLNNPVVCAEYAGFAFVSKWQQARYVAKFPLDPNKTCVLQNAISPKFENQFPTNAAISETKRKPPTLAYTSTPFRGLNLLLDTFPEIRRAVPGTELHVFSSMRVYQWNEAVDEQRYGDLYRRCREMAGVTYVGSLPQASLANELRKISLLAYPNTFAETSCITVMEAMASGCRIVTSDWGALPETTAGFSRLVPMLSPGQPCLRTFRELVIQELRQPWESENSAQNDQLRRQVDFINSQCTWARRAAEWEAWLTKFLKPPADFMPQLLQAAQLLANRQHDHAAEICRRLVVSRPNLGDAWHILGRSTAATGKHDEAIRALTRASLLLPDLPMVQRYLGLSHRAQGNLEAAIQCFHKAISVQPNYQDAYVSLGNTLQLQSKDKEAEAAFRQCLQLNPQHPEARKNLEQLLQKSRMQNFSTSEPPKFIPPGPSLPNSTTHAPNDARTKAMYFIGQAETALSHGKSEDAIRFYRRALDLVPAFPEALNNLGNVLQSRGQLTEAVNCYQQALRAEPNYAPALTNLGHARQRQGDIGEAIAVFRRVVELTPLSANAHVNLGYSLRASGDIENAIACYQKAVEFDPQHVLAFSNLGNAHRVNGDITSSIACYKRAISLQPNYEEAITGLALVLHDCGKLDEAAIFFQRAIRLKPCHAPLYNFLGSVFRRQGKPQEAISQYLRALELDANRAETYCHLGDVHADVGNSEQALGFYQQALTIQPNLAEAHNNLGNIHKELRNFEGAIACFRRAIELKPDFAAALSSLVHLLQHTCRWDDLLELTQRLIELVKRDRNLTPADQVSPFVFVSLPTPTTAEQQLHCARTWAHFRSQVEPINGPGQSFAVAKDPHRKLTIGYLSADFHAHATAWLMAELFEKHHRDRVVVHGYSYGLDDGSAMRQRLMHGFDRFVDVRNFSHEQAARRIAADNVDILVDLKGYTREARTEIVARRPAPLQVNYLGYPGTMGADFIDYILVDDFIVPCAQQQFYSEKLVYLPDCYQVNDGQRLIASHTPTRTECGLPEKAFVFCCFNNSYKISPAIFSIWMELLKSLPNSVLWLLEKNRSVAAHLLNEATAHGVSSDRLVFAPHVPLPEHLSRHRLAHLFLDTFPYNAHTTASDALWAGLPVLTICGETFASRVAGSLLRAVELPELITSSFAEYQARALRLASDKDYLAELKSRLDKKRKTSTLFDAESFATNLEAAYVAMWDLYSSGQPPQPIRVKSTVVGNTHINRTSTST